MDSSEYLISDTRFKRDNKFNIFDYPVVFDSDFLDIRKLALARDILLY